MRDVRDGYCGYYSRVGWSEGGGSFGLSVAEDLDESEGECAKERSARYPEKGHGAGTRMGRLER